MPFIYQQLSFEVEIIDPLDFDKRAYIIILKCTACIFLSEAMQKINWKQPIYIPLTYANA